jgi:hypothetical protein
VRPSTPSQKQQTANLCLSPPTNAEIDFDGIAERRQKIISDLLPYKSSSVTLRKQDFGRRRALGATRTNIVTLVAIHYLLVAAIGITTGISIATIVTIRWTDAPPDTTFTTAIALLALIVTIIAALPPALIAAYRDPVRVLRVP